MCVRVPDWGSAGGMPDGRSVTAARTRQACEPAPADPGVPAGWDDAVVVLYAAHYRPLVRLAAVLVGDVALAEDMVQDCFVALHDASGRLRAVDHARPYLRRAVINRSRSVLRQRAVAERYLARLWVPDAPSAEDSALDLQERYRALSALGTLPTRQREALVLRYYADLTDRQVAAVMGVSTGSVKTHISRALASLRAALEAEPAGQLP